MQGDTFSLNKKRKLQCCCPLLLHTKRGKGNVLFSIYVTLDNFGKCKISLMYISIFLSRSGNFTLLFSLCAYSPYALVMGKGKTCEWK